MADLISPMSRSDWTLRIGCFMVGMGEIEQMTFAIWSHVIGEEITDNWMRKSLGQRILSLQHHLPKDEIGRALSSLLARARDLISIRNILAHGTFADVNCSPVHEPRYVFWRQSRDKTVVTAEQMCESSDLCLQLSGDLALWIAKGRMRRASQALS